MLLELSFVLAAILGPFDLNAPPYPDCEQHSGCSHFRCDAFGFDPLVAGTPLPLDCTSEPPLVGFAAKFHITPTTEIVGVCVFMRFCDGTDSECAYLFDPTVTGGGDRKVPERR